MMQDGMSSLDSTSDADRVTKRTMRVFFVEDWRTGFSSASFFALPGEFPIKKLYAKNAAPAVSTNRSGVIVSNFHKQT